MDRRAPRLHPSGDLENRVHLDRHVARQRSAAHRGARVPPGIAEHLDHQIGGAVDHLRLLAVARHRIDEAAEPHAAHDLVEIAADRGLELRENVDGAEPRGLLRVFQRDFLADLTGELVLAVGVRHLAGDEHQRAGTLERHIVRRRRRRGRQFDVQVLQTCVNAAAHRALPVML